MTMRSKLSVYTKPCGRPSLRQRWMRCSRPRSFRRLRTQEPSCTSVSPATRHPCPSAAPGARGRKRSHGAGPLTGNTPWASAPGEAAAAKEAVTPSSGCDDSPPRIEASDCVARPTEAAQPTAAVAASLPTNARRESIPTSHDLTNDGEALSYVRNRSKEKNRRDEKKTSPGGSCRDLRP